MCRGIALAIALSSPLAAQQSASNPAAAFQSELAIVQECLQRGTFDRAQQRLQKLLEANVGADYARLRKPEIVEIARRCAFELGQHAPKLADLVSGELLHYDASSGKLKIRYTPKKIGDFTRAPSAKGSTTVTLVHPAVFVDSLSIEAECPPRMVAEGGPRFLVGAGTDETLLVCFGGHSSGDMYTPPQILRIKGDTKTVVAKDERGTPPLYEEACNLKVVVGLGVVTAYRDGKRVLQVKRAVKDTGQFCLTGFLTFDRLTLEGKIQPSWPQGLLDAATRVALAKFDKEWRPEKELPAWLFEGGADPKANNAKSGAKSGSNETVTRPSAAFLAREEEIAGLEGRCATAEVEAAWVKAAQEFPKEVEARVELATVQLRRGRFDAAQETCDAALAAGMSAESLHGLPHVVVQARNGPEWRHVFSHATDHYVVKSDIDENVCVEATKVLEESYRSYRIRLAPVPDAEKKKFSVFLFSGKAGYLDYARTTLGSAPENTSGLYSPLLKQLLIWNVPDRAEMFRVVRHEGFHQYFDRLCDAPPIWFNEGTAVYYELADLYGGEWREGQVHRAYAQMVVAPNFAWTPLNQLLGMSTRVFQGPNIAQHYAESWAVVHCLRQGTKEQQELFRRFFAALVEGKSRADATQEVFGQVDLGALEAAVRQHVAKALEAK